MPIQAFGNGDVLDEENDAQKRKLAHLIEDTTSQFVEITPDNFELVTPDGIQLAAADQGLAWEVTDDNDNPISEKEATLREGEADQIGEHYIT